MSATVLYMSMSLDEFMAGPDNDLDFMVDAPQLEDELTGMLMSVADTIVVGCKAFPDMAAYWTTADGDLAAWMNATPKVVLSSDSSYDVGAWENSTLAAIAGRNGVALRPHVKTHKIPTIAWAQVEAGAAGITVAKISEAEVMAEAGLEDIFIAYPLVTDTKIRRAIELAQKLKTLIIGVDSLEGARRLSAAATREGQELDVRLEVDTGLRSTGIPYEGAVGLAREVHALEGLDLTGIYTYRGAVLGGSPTLDLEAPGIEEARLMVTLAEKIREEGMELERLTEEHGMLVVNTDHDLRVGDTLHVIPNHVCSTVNLHDAVYLKDGNGTVEELHVSARGKVW